MFVGSRLKSSPSRRLVTHACLGTTLVVLLTLLGGARQAQSTRTWDGGGADNNWSTAGNWSSDNAPDGTTEAALFTNDTVGQTKLTPNLSADVTLGQLQFSATAPSYTITGGGPSILYLSPATSFGGVGVTVASGAANQSITAAEVFFLSTQSWDIGGTTTLTVTGTIEDDSVVDYGLTKNGGGTLVFPGDVRYDGPTTVNAGAMVLSFGNTSMLSALTVNGGILRATTSANALGNNATRNTITLAGGVLELANNTGLTFGSTSRVTTVTGNAAIRSDRLTAGAGVTHRLGTLRIGAPTLSVTGGANATGGTAGITFGATTLTGNATFNVANSGSANAQLTLGAVGQSGGTRSLTKAGNGTLLLNGAGSYTGGTTLGQGALTLGVGNALGSGGFNFAGGTLNANNTTDNTIGAMAVTANSTLSLSPGGTAGTLTFSGVSGAATGILTITGWSGSPGGSGTNDKVVFSGGITPNADFLQHIRFVLGDGNTYPGALGTGGELIPGAASSGTISFAGVEHLGTPTDTTIAINVVPDAAATIYYEYGTASGVYTQQTAPVAALANEPCEVVLTSLQPNTRYFYRMRYETPANPGAWVARSEYQFQTQRPAGSTYSFVITTDSHVNLQLGSLSEWQTTLDMIAAERPDFMVDLGDTFAVDNGTTSVTSAAAADQVFLFQRGAGVLGRASHSVPMFFAMGNHEDEEGWNFDDVNPLPIWSMTARKKYLPLPSPLTAPWFYSANTDPVDASEVTPPNSHVIGSDQYREDYYAWTWGDALFVVFDPFQYTMQNPYGASAGEGGDDPAVGDRWNWTMGVQQHQWLNQVLSTSTAKYKFLFAHHMLGGTQNYVRGGAEPAHEFEWGGYNADGTTWGWDTKRPAEDGWIKPVRQMMIDYGVTAFFHGHDHQFAYELRDGMVYQEVPAASQGTTSGFGSYNSSPYLINQSSNSGYLRVTISPSQALVEYVKTTGSNVGQVQYSYTMAPAAGPSPPAMVTGMTGAIEVAALPSNLNGGQFISASRIRLMDEGTGIVTAGMPGFQADAARHDPALAIGQPADATFANAIVTPYGGPGLPAAGTAVHSILLHFDPNVSGLPFDLSQGVAQSATITFDRPIIGAYVTSVALDATDAIFGSGTTYPTGNIGRDMEFNYDGDSFSISPDRRTLSLTMFSHNGGVLDQMRVIVPVDAVPITVTVPNVVGQSQASATTAIISAGLAVATTTQSSGTIPIGAVISQDPAGGTTASAGATVSLVISSGITVPNVTGQTQSAATATLTTAGFLVTSSTQASASVPNGSVISQTPAGGTAASGGSTVALVISSGAPANITLANVQSAQNTTAGSFVDLAYTVPNVAGSSLVLVVYGGAEASTTNLALPAGATFHGVAMSVAAQHRTPANDFNAGSGLYWLPVSPNESGTIRMSFTGTCDERAVGAVTLVGAALTGPEAVEIATGTASLSDQITTRSANAMVVSTATQGNSDALTATGTGHVLDVSAGLASSRVAGGHAEVATPSSRTLGYSGSINRIAMILASFPVAGAPPNAPPIVSLTAPADQSTTLGASALLTASVTDTDATTVTFYGRKTVPPVPGPDFVIGTLPDTQYYSQNTGGNLAQIFSAQTQWYADQRVALNIAFISHLGDMVQSGDNGTNNSEWNIADNAMRIIEDPQRTGLPSGIPWGGAPGNHDQTTVGQINAPNAKWNQFFGADRWAGRPYFGGSFSPTNNSNSYYLFNASGLEFLVIHLDYTTAAGVNQAVIDWADGLMKAYPQRRAILVSHWILDVPPTSPSGAQAPFGGPGQRFFDEFKDNPNFFLLLSGHQHGEGRRADVFDGRTVYSVLQDYQERTNGGDGWLRYFVFSPANNTVTAKTYSPTLNRFETDTDATSSPLNQASEFVLPYNMQSAVAPWTTLGTVNVPAGGGSIQFNWTGLDAGSTYEWYVAASDGSNTTTSPSRIFSTAATQTLSTITVTPSSASVSTNGTLTFSASARDQFGAPMSPQPVFSWSTTGGTIDATGLFTADASAGGPFTVTATSGLVSGTASVTVTPVNAAPTIATAAAATPSPVAGTTTTLSALGADDGGEAALTYTWATTGVPPAAVTFSANGTNAAKNTVATFTKAGNYTFQVTIRDAGNLTVTSNVNVTVDAILTSISVTPASASVGTGLTQSFSASARDQFDALLSPQPAFSWSTTGGTIDATGLFTAGASAGGPFTVTATSGPVSGTASVTVTPVNAAPTVATAAAATPSPVTGTTTTLSALGADDGGEAALTYTWATTGVPPAAVTFSANGTNAAKNVLATFTRAGSYTFQVTIRDAGNLTVTSTVGVAVNQTVTTITVAPPSASVVAGGTQPFSASAFDQFGQAVSPSPSFTWGVTGGGTINASGLFSAGAAAGGPFTVTAAASGKNGTASVTVTAPSAGPEYVQGATATASTSTNSIASTFVSANQAGSLIVAAVTWAGDATMTCSDTQGNAYSLAVIHFDSVNWQSLAICYAPNVKAGANTVTATLSYAFGRRRMLIHEYRGVALASPVDVTARNVANGSATANAITSTAATTTTSGDLIFGVVMDTSGATSVTAGTGFTQRLSVNNKDLVSEDLVQSSAGSIAATQTFSRADRYLALMVAFKHQ